MIDLLDVAEVTTALGLLYAPGDVFEVRVLEGREGRSNRGWTWSGWFDRVDAVAQQLRRLSGWNAVYVTPNPVDPLLLHRRANELAVAGRGDTTNDTQIARRAWLLADFDPVVWGSSPRPIKGIASTDAEHAAAIDRARRVAADLSAAGWPTPLFGDSGNGAHLMWSVDLPVNSDLPRRFLHALANRYGDDVGDDDAGWNRDAAVVVDLAIYNPARIWKLYGTLACKGAGVGDRPWRQARVLSPPAGTLSADTLQAWIEQVESTATTATPAPTTPATTATHAPGEFDPLAIVRGAGLQPGAGHTRNDGTTFHELAECPCDRKTQRKAYVCVGKNGAVGMGCRHESCAFSDSKGGQGDHWKRFRAAHDASYGAEPRQQVDAAQRASDFAASFSVDDFAPPRSATTATHAPTTPATTATPAPTTPATTATPAPARRSRADDSRVRVVVTGDARDVRDEVLDALAGANGIYLSQGRLATVADGRMIPLRGGALDSAAVNACRFVKVQRDRSTSEWVDRPDSLPLRIRGMLEQLDALQGGHAERFRAVDLITSSPFYAPDGEFVVQPGYNAAARTLLQSPPAITRYPEPDAGAALEYLRDLVADFPFEGPAEIANWIGAALVPMVRPMIDGPVPMLLIEGNVPGLGKSFLASAIRILYGLQSEAGALPKDERMVATLIPSVLRDAKAIHVFDDVTHTVNSATLNRLLTCRTYSDRVLGVTETATYAVRQLFVMTLNNARASVDMLRRVFRTRLRHSGAGRPEERRGFRHADFLGHVEQHRGEILSRLAQLVDNWIDAGRPEPADLPTMGSFESFARVIGGILFAAGERNWLGNISATKEALSLDDDWPPFVAAWWEKFRRVAQRPASLHTLAVTKDLLLSVRSAGNDAAQIERIRYQLRVRRDHVIGSYRIVEGVDKLGQRIYSLQEAESQLQLH